MFGIGLVPGAVGALLLALPFNLSNSQREIVLQVVALGIYAGYFTWFWSRRGQTLPMQTWLIRVETARGQRLSPGRALLRFAAACLWVLPAVTISAINHWKGWDMLAAVAVGVAGYGLLSYLHPQRQFLHDMLCGTRLVSTRGHRVAST